MKRFFLWLPVLIISGCSLIPIRHELPPAGPLACNELVTSLERDIESYTHFDPTLQRVAAHPLLRSNRWLASYAEDSKTANASRQWLNQLSALAVDAFLIEFERLPDNVKAKWHTRLQSQRLDTVLQQCRAAYLAQAPQLTQDLIDELTPEDNYGNWQRILGVYPLTKRLANGSIERYRQEMTERVRQGQQRTFDNSLYYQASAEAVSVGKTEVSQNQANVSSDPAEVATLFARHAPVLEIEQTSAADQIGSPHFSRQNNIDVDIHAPAAFTYISQIRYGEAVFLQLNYVYWFASRPKTSAWDLYGGDLDSLIWRVTLNTNGQPVLYDTIHSCGCYHLLFMPSGTQIDPHRIKGEKPLYFSLAQPPDAAPQTSDVPKLRLKIESGTHYLVDVAPLDSINPALRSPVLRYKLEPYNALLVLPAAEGRRSLFGSSGIIAQSSRLERYLLWPLGVPNAGAMRQAGMHAIAFIGKRHFDDPWLLEELGITIPSR